MLNVRWRYLQLASAIPNPQSVIRNRNVGQSVETQELIDNYIAAQPEPKSGDMRALHTLITRLAPGCRLWFADGKNSEGKVVSNPNIGYGEYIIRYADGSTKEFFRIGLSANTSGISVYVMGLADKTYLARTFGTTIGKASVTGYCIKFRILKDIDLEILQAAIRYGFEAGNESE